MCLEAFCVLTLYPKCASQIRWNIVLWGCVINITIFFEHETRKTFGELQQIESQENNCWVECKWNLATNFQRIISLGDLERPRDWSRMLTYWASKHKEVLFCPKRINFLFIMGSDDHFKNRGCLFKILEEKNSFGLESLESQVTWFLLKFLGLCHETDTSMILLADTMTLCQKQWHI